MEIFIFLSDFLPLFAYYPPCWSTLSSGESLEGRLRRAGEKGQIELAHQVGRRLSPFRLAPLPSLAPFLPLPIPPPPKPTAYSQPG